MAAKKKVAEERIDEIDVGVSESEITDLVSTINRANISADMDSDKTEALVKAIDSFISENNLDQKSRLTFKQIAFIVKNNAINEYLMNTYGFRNEITHFICQDLLAKMVSHQGKGRSELIAFFKGLNEEAKENAKIKING
jgi:hypothetical protein